MIVTIDGPAGTGKSSVARALAKRLGWNFLDTGAMYRAVAWKCVEQGCDLSHSDSVTACTRMLSFSLASDQLQLDGHPLGAEIRSPEVTQAASLIAQQPEVRAILVDQQRELASSHQVVTEGRDQGTVVFPNAEFKFFLTATPEVRARRRYLELQKSTPDVSYEQTLQEQIQRDERDQNREHAPLKPADDAQLVDTSEMDFETVINELQAVIRNRMDAESDE